MINNKERILLLAQNQTDVFVGGIEIGKAVVRFLSDENHAPRVIAYYAGEIAGSIASFAAPEEKDAAVAGAIIGAEEVLQETGVAI